MSFEELLKSLGIEQAEIEKITGGMKENKIYLSANEHIDDRYTKLKAQNDSNAEALSQANALIEQLKGDSASTEQMKAQIAEYQKQAEEAKAELSRVAVAAVATELGMGYAEAEEACDVSVNFLNPAMPTLAQQTDSSIKLASAVDGFAGTPTFWRLNGLDDDEVRNVVSEIRRNVTKAAAFDLMAGVRQASDAAASDD